VDSVLAPPHIVTLDVVLFCSVLMILAELLTCVLGVNCARQLSAAAAEAEAQAAGHTHKFSSPHGACRTLFVCGVCADCLSLNLCLVAAITVAGCALGERCLSDCLSIRPTSRLTCTCGRSQRLSNAVSYIQFHLRSMTAGLVEAVVIVNV
jgi:hypothetical protein